MDSFRFFESVRFAAATVASLLLASPAYAVPFAATFTGPDGIGISEADAFDARDNYEISIITTAFLDDHDPYLNVISRDLDVGSVDPFPPGSGPTVGTSEWELENQSSSDLIGDTYLAFVTSVFFEVGGEQVGYLDENVGIVMEATDGWVLIHAVDTQTGNDLYYPALFIDDEWLVGDRSGLIPITYYLNQELVVLNSTILLPKLQLAIGFTPVPEPGTAALLATGLIGIAMSRRRA